MASPLRSRAGSDRIPKDYSSDSEEVDLALADRGHGAARPVLAEVVQLLRLRVVAKETMILLDAPEE